MTEIRLGSTLGKKFGRSHWVHLDSKTPREAVKWLTTIFPEAKKLLATAHLRGIEFAIFRGRGKHRENISKDQLGEPAGDRIQIMPVHAGAKGGLLQTIVGVILIAADVIFLHTGVLTNVGIAMVAGGVMQMLSPQPRTNKNADSANNQASYVFNGPTNTTAQGNNVPVIYGRVRAGSAVVSAGMDAEDYAAATSGVGAGTATGGFKTSPYDLLN
ncbi:tail assembly protein [Dyella sp.]|uniref:tail assembly protein n=1 Tax=Dyella sp. TaxID=1869338 RepID=UPI00283ED275|nr:tail assembly protein [Dyella sp.]MDR3446017.1 tail assembly protein [Dyella sp.]